MSRVNDRAARAYTLSQDETFNEICAEILEEARILFMGRNSAITEWTQASEKVRAVETFRAAIQSRLTEKAIADKREAQHRAND